MAVLRTWVVAACLFFVTCVSLHAENWPGYEGLRHQSSSPMEIAGTLEVAWQHHFTDMVIIPDGQNWTAGEGQMYSRNLVVFNGWLAVADTVDPGVPDYPTGKACVTVMNAVDGSVLNCVMTAQHKGAYKSMLDATETAYGEQVLAWDPDTGILFLSIGGDMPAHSAILPMANAGSFSGTYQQGVGAYQQLGAEHPGLQSSRARTRAEESSLHSMGAPLPVNEWDSQEAFPNRCAFFDVQPGSVYLVIPRTLPTIPPRAAASPTSTLVSASVRIGTNGAALPRRVSPCFTTGAACRWTASVSTMWGRTYRGCSGIAQASKP